MPKIYHLRHLRPGTLHAEQWQEPSHDVSAIQRRPDTSLVVEVQVMPIHMSSRRASEATELEQGVVVIGMPGALPFQKPVAPIRQAIKPTAPVSSMIKYSLRLPQAMPRASKCWYLQTIKRRTGSSAIDGSRSFCGFDKGSMCSYSTYIGLTVVPI